jgi:hypothetical protein
MERLLKFHKKYVLYVSDDIPDVYKSTYKAILDETYWDLFTNPQFDTEESKMIKLFCDEQIKAINIPPSVDKQKIKNIITNTEKYKIFVDNIIMVDDDVANEFTKFYEHLITKHYKDFKKDNMYMYIAMNLKFFESWLDTPYVSEKSKQREYCAKRMLDKFNKDLYDVDLFINQFTNSVNYVKEELDYTDYANLINYRDYVPSSNK